MKWIMAGYMPFATGESSEFMDMIWLLKKVITPPDYRSILDIPTAKNLQEMAKLKVIV
jgi:hypothetical protein